MRNRFARAANKLIEANRESAVQQNSSQPPCVPLKTLLNAVIWLYSALLRNIDVY